MTSRMGGFASGASGFVSSGGGSGGSAGGGLVRGRRDVLAASHRVNKAAAFLKTPSSAIRAPRYVEAGSRVYALTARDVPDISRTIVAARAGRPRAEGGRVRVP